MFYDEIVEEVKKNGKNMPQNLITTFVKFNTIIGHCYCRTEHIAEIHTTSSLHVMPL